MRVLLLFLLLCVLSPIVADPVTRITDLKQWKKLTKTKNNILMVYGQNAKSLAAVQTVLGDTAKDIHGIGSIATLDCEGAGNQKNIKDVKKMCKNVEFDATPVSPGLVFQHFEKGVEKKLYDRALNVKSLSTFMRDPSGDQPWAEDQAAKHVVHLTDDNFEKTIARKLPTLVMFYAPWCGHCKNLKPAWAEAATTLKGEKFKGLIAAIDANSPQGRKTAQKYEVTGYPALKYFNKGKFVHGFEGGRDAASIVAWMKNPTPPPPPPPPEVMWPELPGTNVTHLTDATWSSELTKAEHALVMFYAPWCGHCKRAKPDYDAAAGDIKLEKPDGSSILAAIDATVHQKTIKKFPEVKGYPTFIYFSKGKKVKEFEGGRDYKGFINFIRNPNDASANSASTYEPAKDEPVDPESKVVQLYTDTFQKTLDASPHALVMFYAPWCGHCKAFKPHLKTAAADLADTLPQATIAQIDCTVHGNVCQSHGVKGYPTVKYFENGKFIEEFNDRGAEHVKLFIQQKVRSKREL